MPSTEVDAEVRAAPPELSSANVHPVLQETSKNTTPRATLLPVVYEIVVFPAVRFRQYQMSKLRREFSVTFVPVARVHDPVHAPAVGELAELLKKAPNRIPRFPAVVAVRVAVVQVVPEVDPHVPAVMFFTD